MTDQELEALIDQAGRRAVFLLMEANGWRRGEMGIPKWAWAEAAHQIIAARRSNDSIAASEDLMQ